MCCPISGTSIWGTSKQPQNATKNDTFLGWMAKIGLFPRFRHMGLSENMLT